MKVLHVLAGIAPQLGGPSIAVPQLCQALSAVGVETAIFTTDAGQPAGAGKVRLDRAELPRDVEVEVFPVKMPWRWSYAPALGRALRSGVAAFDVVHIHALFLYPQFAAVRAAKACGVPYIIAPCGALDPWIRRKNRSVKRINDLVWQRNALDEAAYVHFKTGEEERLAEDLKLRAPARVVPNALSLEAFADLPARDMFRDQYLDGYRGPLVVNVGRISRKKRLDTLIEACSQVERGGLPLKVVLAGPDDEGLVHGLRAQAAGLGLDVRFPGMLNREQVYAVLAAADAWALPSYTENFGQAAVEALAAGVPCVLSTEINIAAEAEAAGAALVVPPEAPAFAAALVALLTDRAHAARLRSAGQTFAQRFDTALVVREILAMYEEASVKRSTGSRVG